MLRIEDYYTNAPSAGITTFLDKPEIVNRLMNIFYMNFKGYDYNRMKIEVYSVREELEEYKNLSPTLLDQIRRVRVYYDDQQLALKRILNDINHDTHLNTKVYSPVVGCSINCRYCFSKKVFDHFGVTDRLRKPEFRGPYKLFKDADGNDIPELFNIESETPIDWFLTYMSDFGCWAPEWQENVLEQIIAANEMKRRKGKCPDTFQLVTKCPKGIDLSSVPEDTDIRNVVISCTVDKNSVTDRISELIGKIKSRRVTACVVYQPVLEYIEPVHLEEFVKAFGKGNSWVVIGSEIGENAVPLEFAWIKDIIDKCIELDIPVKMEYDIKRIVEENGYTFLVQEPEPMQETRAVRNRYFAMKAAETSEKYDRKVEELNRKLKKCPSSDKISIADSIMFGSVDITVENSKRLLEKSPDFDIILTAESKGIPLAYEMSRQSGKVYIVARKSVNQTASVREMAKEFYLDADDTNLIRDKRVLIVDDIVSTGESFKALNALVEKSFGSTAAKVAVLAENNIAKRDNIIFLEQLSV
ncbi:DUF5131 family protein [Ruminococcus sp.]|uniref:DUF5131 family protein n=1 Tax=Ruminococcus sp. TaxID=41978 RepID=UPI0025D5B763|nr:DUF5131 family protein [Ruminococcus sp.]